MKKLFDFSLIWSWRDIIYRRINLNERGEPDGLYNLTRKSIYKKIKTCYNKGEINNDNVDDIIMHWPDSNTNQLRLRVCFVDTTSTPVEINTYNTVSTSVITGVDTVYRVHVGDFNDWGTDVITEIASPATAYRSISLANLGTANGFLEYTYSHQLRTYFYIDYQ